MNAQQAVALAAYVNGNDARFRAQTLTVPLEPGSEGAIVILTDRNTGGNPPFLTDTREYAEHLIRYNYGPEAVRQFESWMSASPRRAPQPKVL